MTGGARKAKKAREASLKEQRAKVQALLRTENRHAEAVYVLEGSADGEPSAAPSDRIDEVRVANDDEEDAVVVELRASEHHAMTDGQQGKSKRNVEKVMWSALKMEVLAQRTDTLAVEAARAIEEHDGNALDPHFTALMKSVRGSVPVPSHWHMLSEFLAKQADRESASAIVPLEIEATDIRELRASKDPKTFLNMNRIAFVRCFSVGTPLAMKTFGVRLTKLGDAFDEGRWYPKVDCTPTVLSKELKEALGMKSPVAPPPWLYSMQLMKRLPPAYLFLRIPGMNAPIPDGAQWGGGEGMWGHAPRNENGSPSFPGVMGDVIGGGAASAAACWRPWGCIAPPLSSAVAAPVEVAPMAAAVSSTPVGGANKPPPTMVQAQPIAAPFIPSPFQAPMTAAQRAGPVREQEYTRAQDAVTAGIVAQGGVLLPRAPMGMGPPPPPGLPTKAMHQTHPHAAPPPPPPPSTKF